MASEQIEYCGACPHYGRCDREGCVYDKTAGTPSGSEADELPELGEGRDR